jgi:hypothetical protein
MPFKPRPPTSPVSTSAEPGNRNNNERRNRGDADLPLPSPEPVSLMLAGVNFVGYTMPFTMAMRQASPACVTILDLVELSG